MSTEMNADCNSERQTTLETVFATAVELIAEMDKSLLSSDGMVSVVPSVVTWMMDQTSPELMTEVRKSGLQDAFSALLEEYSTLRRRTQQMLFVSHSYDSNVTEEQALLLTRITFDDLMDALSAQGRSVVSAAFRKNFNSILPLVQEKLELIDEIPWGDEEPVGPCGNADTVRKPLFDHYRAYWYAVKRGDPSGYCDDLFYLATKWFWSTLERMDDGRHSHFWPTVYTSVLGEWIQTASPACAHFVERGGLISDFYGEATSYVSTMQDAELQWRRLSEPLRALLSTHTADDDEATHIIALMLDVSKRREDGRDATPRCVYEVFCRRLTADQISNTSELVQLSLSSEVIDAIRRDKASWEACYLVDSSALPKPFADRIVERQCIAVRLPQERLQLLDKLLLDRGVDSIFSRMSDGTQPRVHLTVNHAFWAPKQDLWPHMFRFREAIPVLYIFEETCALVQYRFNHFADLRRVADVPARHMAAATLDEGDWRYAAAYYVSTLADGRQVKPAILTTVEDLTTHVSLSDWPAAIA
jgi:hypothetical protein